MWTKGSNRAKLYSFESMIMFFESSETHKMTLPDHVRSTLQKYDLFAKLVPKQTVSDLVEWT